MLIQKYIAIRLKEEEDFEEQHADTAYLARTEDDSEVDLTSDAESDTDRENEVLILLDHFINLKAYLLK